MSTKTKIAYISASAVVIAAIVGIIPVIVKTNYKPLANSGNELSGKLTMPIDDLDYNTENIFEESEINIGDHSTIIMGNGNIINYGNSAKTENNSSYDIEPSLTSVNASEFYSKDTTSKIAVSEMHTPDDYVTSVSYPNWNESDDYGIDGNRYGGGIKISISNLFTSLGDNGSKEIASRIMIPLFDEFKSLPIEERIFSGVFILHQSMFGSKSTATINIIINNEILFESEEINCYITEPIPFSINYGDADSIIVEINAVLRGSDFVLGMVNSKEM